MFPFGVQISPITHLSALLYGVIAAAELQELAEQQQSHSQHLLSVISPAVTVVSRFSNSNAYLLPLSLIE